MKNRGKTIMTLTAGMFLGAALLGGAAQAAELYYRATPSLNTVYLDGQRVELEAMAINGSNYVKLRDVGKLVNFNVYWDGANVQVDSDAPYTGVAPASALPQPSPQPVPSTAPVTQDIEALRQEMVDRTNAVRLENGVDALPTDPLLMRAA